MLNIVVILGSVRRERVGIKPARYLVEQCKTRGHQVTLVDPVEFPLPLLDRMYKEYETGQAPEILERLATIIKSADAYLIVSAEYNHSIPPALSNLLDHFLEEYFFRPSAIACYSAGAFGGVRAAMQLRAMLGELGMPSIPSILPFPKVQDTFDDQGHPTDERLARSDRAIPRRAGMVRARPQGGAGAGASLWMRLCWSPPRSPGIRPGQRLGFENSWSGRATGLLVPRAAGDGLGELHVPDAGGEVGAGDGALAADRGDEVGLDPPAAAELLGDRQHLQPGVLAAAADDLVAGQLVDERPLAAVHRDRPSACRARRRR